MDTMMAVTMEKTGAASRRSLKRAGSRWLAGLCAVPALAAALLAGEQALANPLNQPVVQVGYTYTETRSHIYEQGFVHPVTFWWDQDPSRKGAWDYYTPVANAHQPIPFITRRPVRVVSRQPVVTQPLPAVAVQAVPSMAYAVPSAVTPGAVYGANYPYPPQAAGRVYR